MKRKPYKARSIEGAETRVRQLQKQYDDLDKLARKYHLERNLLAMLSATGPCFNNPLEAMMAEQVRDDVLRISCRLNPDGTQIK